MERLLSFASALSTGARIRSHSGCIVWRAICSSLIDENFKARFWEIEIQEESSMISPVPQPRFAHGSRQMPNDAEVPPAG
jgi:hypothetical protein